MNHLHPFQLQYSEPTTHPAAFDAFYNLYPYTQFIPPTNATLPSLLELANGQFALGTIRTYGETFSHQVDTAFMSEAYDIFVYETAQLPSGTTATWMPTAISPNFAKLGLQHGGNLLGLLEIPQQWHEWFINWKDPALDAQIYALSRTITAKLVAAAQAKGVLLPYLFMNTAGTAQGVLDSFGAANVQTIKKVAARYDLGKVFQRLQHDGYLIRKVS
jgi:hypothetical protein